VQIRGTVTEFDESRGLGVLRSDLGAHYGFHCVDIADGSRTIAVNARVRTVRHVGLSGHDDVVAVEPDI